MLCDRPALAVMNASVPGVVWRMVMCVLAGLECNAHFVFVALVVCTGSVFLQAALQWSSKAEMASQVHRSAWPGMCASANVGSGM